jgi:hypothetical protein
MTPADRASHARGRSLPIEWGALPPNAPSRPSPYPRDGRTAQVLSSEYDYATYAPPGTRCAACGQCIEPDQVARRATTDRTSAGPAMSYRHLPKDCPKEQP